MRTIAGRGKYDTPDQTTTQLTLLNFFLMGKIPHVIACAGTLFLSFMIMFSLVYVSIAAPPREQRAECLTPMAVSPNPRQCVARYGRMDTVAQAFVS